MKILIVDDSEVVRSVVRQALQSGGYNDLLEASDGLQALQIAKTASREIALYVLDVNMPNLDGITLVGELRQLTKTAVIIMLTTVTDKEKMVTAKELGATGWIVKPFSAPKFIEVVNMFMKE